MNTKLLSVATGLCIATLTSCNTKVGTGDNMAEQDIQDSSRVLMQDSMTGDWQDKWFLDGKKAVLEHHNDGLHFTATPSNVDKRVDRATFDAHHATLWTKQEFEGDILIRYEISRISKGFTFLLYIQAQGIGLPPYVEDIYAWRDLRDVSAMNKYFEYMSLISLSFRENIRCKRYPWKDVERNLDFSNDVLFEPMLEHDGIIVGKRYSVEVEKREKTLKLSVREIENPKNVIEQTWDTSKNPEEQRPRFVEKGRIGLRHMGGTAVIYKNFSVEKL